MGKAIASLRAGAVIGVVGAGTMGAGIAQLAVEHDHEVVLNDVDEPAIDRGRARIRAGLARRAAKSNLDEAATARWLDGRLALVRDAHTLDAVGAEAEIVVEAALEDLGLKREIFRALDAAALPDSILASNTSALSIAEIAAVTARPERILGLHFFNPAPVMALVELVVTERTDPDIANRAAALVTGWGKVVVRSADAPGFIVNRVNRPFTLVALGLLDAGEARIAEIDGALRAARYPMGPFELMDFTGLDVTLAASHGIHEGFARLGDSGADRFRPSAIQQRLVDEGRLGRKAGRGFYTYDRDGRPIAPEADVDAPARRRPRLAPAEIVARIENAILDEARRMADAGLATADDIDLALKLGAGHPLGPFERAAGRAGRE